MRTGAGGQSVKSFPGVTSRTLTISCIHQALSSSQALAFWVNEEVVVADRSPGKGRELTTQPEKRARNPKSEGLWWPRVAKTVAAPKQGVWVQLPGQGIRSHMLHQDLAQPNK